MGSSNRKAGRMPILTYHSIDDSGSVVSMSPERFAQHMAAVAESGFRACSLAEALDDRGELGRWPDKHVAVTFDDGFHNVMDHAAPVLRTHGFTATIFAVTGHVGGRNDWSPPPERLGDQPLMTWTELKAWVDSGMEVGGHSATHPDLRSLSDARIKIELLACKKAIEERLDRPARTFAYPFGRYNERVKEMVASCFDAACTTVLRRTGDEPAHLLPRVDAYYLRGPRDVRRLLAGKRDAYLAIRRWGRALRGS